MEQNQPLHAATTTFRVAEMPERPGRFAIVDPDTGETIDNANGYGYRDKTNAYRAGWFKFGGGAKKVAEAVSWWNRPEHAEFRKWIAETRSLLLDECRDAHRPAAGIRKYLEGKALEYASEHGIGDYRPEYFKSWRNTL